MADPMFQVPLHYLTREELNALDPVEYWTRALEESRREVRHRRRMLAEAKAEKEAQQ